MGVVAKRVEGRHGRLNPLDSWPLSFEDKSKCQILLTHIDMV